MRVICFNDDVDTNEEGWQDRLRDAARHHAKANFYTRQRLKRKIESLWKLGAAVSKLRPGYQRTPTLPATDREPEKGPFYDSIDEKWAPLVCAAFDRIANQEPPWIVGPWLKQQGLPGFVDCESTVLLARNTIALIHRTIYRGVDRHRVKIVRKRLRSGKKTMVWNEENDIFTREMPHLRIVPDALWYRANKAIDARTRRMKYDKGEDHPLFGIPRNSRGPLSQCFICGICGQKMYRDRRNEGGYCCSGVRKGTCWNRATALCSRTHERIGAAIGEKLLSLSGIADELVAHVQRLHQNDDQLCEREAKLNSDERRLVQQQTRLRKLAASDDDPPTTLVADLKAIEKDLAEVRAWIEELNDEALQQKPEVTREKIVETLRQVASKLLAMVPEVGPMLEQLVPGKIRAVPYRQFRTTNVVLRAEFELQLVNLLPHQLRAALEGTALETTEWLAPIKISVDLFQHAEVPANALKAVAMYEDKDLTLDALAIALGMTRRNAHLSKDLGIAMRASGLTDPYTRLTESPADLGRWKLHPKFRQDMGGDQDAA